MWLLAALCSPALSVFLCDTVLLTQRHPEVLVLGAGRWQGLGAGLGCADERRSCVLWTARLSWLLSVAWLRVKLWYTTPGICAFWNFFMFKWTEVENWGGPQEVSLIFIRLRVKEVWRPFCFICFQPLLCCCSPSLHYLSCFGFTSWNYSTFACAILLYLGSTVLHKAEAMNQDNHDNKL